MSRTQALISSCAEVFKNVPQSPRLYTETAYDVSIQTNLWAAYSHPSGKTQIEIGDNLSYI
jgi:hypothetical protein